MDLGLKDKVALVTGGSSGIGLAIAARLAAEGCKVAISGRDQAKLATAAKQIAGARAFGADVRDPAQMIKLAGEVIAAFGRIDIVVSNAGTHLPGRMEDVETSALLKHLETKVIGPWALAKAVAPHMRKQGGGRFIVIIGQAGKVPQANGIASTISNAAQHAFVKSLSDDLARDKILVNAVCPSRIESPLTKALGHLYNEVHLGRSLEQQESQWGAEVPLGRWGTADDIANAVAFVASERAGFMVGSNIDVDGGHQRMIF
jgi:3-oxoacyl-[acyl-carrier protein] reductase